ncbi:MAG: hypothetical protein WAL42_01700 [Nitrososphaeraceae archaeon]
MLLKTGEVSISELLVKELSNDEKGAKDSFCPNARGEILRINMRKVSSKSVSFMLPK